MPDEPDSTKPLLKCYQNKTELRKFLIRKHDFGMSSGIIAGRDVILHKVEVIKKRRN